jgi:hypothetical protein
LAEALAEAFGRMKSVQFHPSMRGLLEGVYRKCVRREARALSPWDGAVSPIRRRDLRVISATSEQRPTSPCCLPLLCSLCGSLEMFTECGIQNLPLVSSSPHPIALRKRHAVYVVYRQCNQPAASQLSVSISPRTLHYLYSTK